MEIMFNLIIEIFYIMAKIWQMQFSPPTKFVLGPRENQGTTYFILIEEYVRNPYYLVKSDGF